VIGTKLFGSACKVAFTKVQRGRILYGYLLIIRAPFRIVSAFSLAASTPVAAP
jgi:hypothetical protein